MPAPNARQLEQRAEEARAIADQMGDPLTKRTMANLALSYERLAKHAAAREVSDSKQSRTVLGDCWRGWRCAAVYLLLNPDPHLAYWGASQRTDGPLVIVLLIGLAMAANYTLWATP